MRGDKNDDEGWGVLGDDASDTTGNVIWREPAGGRGGGCVGREGRNRRGAPGTSVVQKAVAWMRLVGVMGFCEGVKEWRGGWMGRGEQK